MKYITILPPCQSAQLRQAIRTRERYQRYIADKLRVAQKKPKTSFMEEYKILPPDQLEEVKRLILDGELYQHDIAAMLGINQGRISELKNGKRHHLKVKHLLW